MGPHIQEKSDSTILAAFELAWILPLGFCALGYYMLDLRGWNLVTFAGLCIVASLCLAFYSVAEFLERRDKKRGSKQNRR